MTKLSIIIPVYNTSQYLPKCIESCLNQDLNIEDYEIILVDDGSTDNSLDIIRFYENNSKNIQVYSQENQKQGAARNNGLDKARGKYIWFIDSDDWIEENILKDLLEYAKIHSPDLMRFDTALNKEENFIGIRSCGHEPNRTYHGHEVFLENKFSVCAPYHLFRHGFLVENDIQFLEKIFYEDNEYMLRVFEKLKKFQYFPKTCYNLRIREGSTTRSNNYRRKLDLITVIQAQSAYLDLPDLSREVKMIFQKFIAVQMNSLLIGTVCSHEIFNEAIIALRGVEKLGYNIRQSRSTKHILQYELLKYPRILRKLMLTSCGKS